MRLTLRTMLAYLDDLLEGDDAQEIGKKIEESERATGLMHRIRDVTRRLRLGAPPLGEQAAGLDANTVAEYLDNTLSADRVLDFEKVCLESDIHLAEVASCHQVLALVLGEPAEVDPLSRQRIYQLPDLVAAQAKAAPEAEAAADPEPVLSDGQNRAEAKEPPRRPRPTIPDYLRQEAERSRRRWSALLAIFLLACLGVVGWGVLNRYGAETPLGKMLGLAPRETTAARAQPAAEAEPQESKPKATEVAAVETTAPKTASTDAKEPSPPKGETLKPLPAVEPPSDAPPAPTPPTPTPPAAESPAAAPESPAAGDSPMPDSPQVAMTGGGATQEPPPGAEVEGKAPPAAPSEGAPGPAEQVGQYISPREVLLKADGDVFNWVRLAEQTVLVAGDRCLSLPTYRPVIMLGEDLHLQLVDATHLLFVPNDPREAEKAPGILVDHGKLVITTEGKTKTGLRLQIGDRKGIIRFTDDATTMAIDVGRGTLPNADPETHPASLTAKLYVTRGRVLWQDTSSREVVSFDGPSEIALDRAPATAAPLKAIPSWIDVATISLLDQRASTTVERELQTNRPVLLTFRELAEHRQKEVRSLAQRCLATIGDFQLMVAALDDPDQKAVWSDYVEQLRAAVQRSPLAAAQVRGAIERVYGGPAKAAAGASLYELLWKYQPDALTPDDAARLIDYLEHNVLAVRVLAYWNLKNITGLGLYYRPEDTAARREPAIAKWRERLKMSPALRGRNQEETPPLPPAAEEPAPPPPGAW
jgi:hypothetical protein